MVSLTKAEAAALGQRTAQPVKAPGELLAVFVSGRLVNPLNASAWGWQKRSRTAKAWKERTAAALAESGGHTVLGHSRVLGFSYARPNRQPFGVSTSAPSEMPKRVTFLAHVHNRFDSDGLQASIKPTRDALVECGVISGDADRDGHRFEYHQHIDRARRGIEIRVSLLSAG